MAWQRWEVRTLTLPSDSENDSVDRKDHHEPKVFGQLKLEDTHRVEHDLMQ
jgi:hypothetical protein